MGHGYHIKATTDIRCFHQDGQATFFHGFPDKNPCGRNFSLYVLFWVWPPYEIRKNFQRDYTNPNSLNLRTRNGYKEDLEWATTQGLSIRFSCQTSRVLLRQRTAWRKLDQYSYFFLVIWGNSLNINLANINFLFHLLHIRNKEFILARCMLRQLPQI